MKNGKDTILLVQPTDAAYGTDALVISGQTESSHSIENSVKDEQTKFGRIVGYGDNSESFEFTAYGQKNDPGQMAVLQAIKDKKQLKIWEVDITLDENEEHDVIFAYVIVESVERSEPQDGYEELKGKFQVYGKSATGKIDKLPLEVIEFGRYGFEKPGEYTGEADDRKKNPTP